MARFVKALAFLVAGLAFAGARLHTGDDGLNRQLVVDKESGRELLANNNDDIPEETLLKILGLMYLKLKRTPAPTAAPTVPPSKKKKGKGNRSRNLMVEDEEVMQSLDENDRALMAAAGDDIPEETLLKILGLMYLKLKRTPAPTAAPTVPPSKKKKGKGNRSRDLMAEDEEVMQSLDENDRALMAAAGDDIPEETILKILGLMYLKLKRTPAPTAAPTVPPSKKKKGKGTRSRDLMVEDDENDRPDEMLLKNILAKIKAKLKPTDAPTAAPTEPPSKKKKGGKKTKESKGKGERGLTGRNV